MRHLSISCRRVKLTVTLWVWLLVGVGLVFVERVLAVPALALAGAPASRLVALAIRFDAFALFALAGLAGLLLLSLLLLEGQKHFLAFGVALVVLAERAPTVLIALPSRHKADAVALSALRLFASAKKILFQGI